MDVYTLIYGFEVVGIFTDKDEFKQQSFHFILDTLLNNNLFVNKKECGMAIKSDLKNLYGLDDYSFSYNGHKFSKMTSEANKIRYITIPKQYSVDTKFIAYKASELQKPLTMLSVDDLITKK
jgi:hypothetical protein